MHLGTGMSVESTVLLFLLICTSQKPSGQLCLTVVFVALRREEAETFIIDFSQGTTDSKQNNKKAVVVSRGIYEKWQTEHKSKIIELLINYTSIKTEFVVV